MNYASFIIKIIKKPKQSFFKKEIPLTEISGKLYQIRNKKKIEIPVSLSLWGNLAYDTMQYYHINDYVIVEGYVSLREKISSGYQIPVDKHIEVSGFKIYPFLLDSIQLTKMDK